MRIERESSFDCKDEILQFGYLCNLTIGAIMNISIIQEE